MRRLATATLIAAILAGPSMAESFRTIEDRGGFVNLVQDRELKRLGVRLKVTDDGRILGRAFGQNVTGEWRWDGGYFCRDLAWGGDPLDFNCQLVQIDGNTLRFTSDRGAGEHADLRLD